MWRKKSSRRAEASASGRNRIGISKGGGAEELPAFLVHIIGSMCSISAFHRKISLSDHQHLVHEK